MLGGGLLQVASRGRVGYMQMSRPRANATGVRAENKQSVWVGLAGGLSCKGTCNEEE